MNKKSKFLLFFIVLSASLLGCLFSINAEVLVEDVGYPVSDGSANPAVNQAVGVAAFVNGSNYVYGILDRTFALVRSQSGSATGLKMLILDANGELLRVSDVYQTTNTTMHEAEFTWSSYADDLVMGADSDYCFMVVGNITWTVGTFSGGVYPYEVRTDLTNSYASPTNAYDFASTGSYYNVYISYYGYDAVPTPYPEPESGLSVWLTTLFSWVGALIILLFPSFLLGVVFRGGKWGFMFGALVGAGVGYWVMPSVVPLWIVVAVCVGVVGMVYVAISQGG